MSSNDFEKDFFKLMNNAVFGKTMENLRNRRNITLINNPRKLMQGTAQPTFKSFKVFHENLVAVERGKVDLCLNRPVVARFLILDISETLMYDFHHNYIKKKYPNDKSKLLFTDTDSLTYTIRTDDLYHDMYIDKSKFDFSAYPPESIYCNTENKKKIGKMKDEMDGVAIKEFVGIRAKMYSILTTSKKETKKAKGVKKSMVKHRVKHSNYIDCLLNERTYLHNMTSFRSSSHLITTITQNKKSLTPYDDKRYLHLFFYKQSIFDPRPENCLSFSKKSPQKIV